MYQQYFSLMQMIPSPDWVVGVSKENLCLANCSWVENLTLDLFPWDIGTQRLVSPNLTFKDKPFYFVWCLKRMELLIMYYVLTILN